MTFVHVDIDNLWIYETEYNTPRSGLDSVMFERALPRALELFSKLGIKATFFVVGKDLELAECRDFLSRACRMGHELANHTFSHPPTWYRYTASEKEREIRTCHDTLAELSGTPPCGFRAPGYCIDQTTVEVLIRLGYRYDTSVLRSPVVRLIPWYIRWKSRSRLDKAFGTRVPLLKKGNLSYLCSTTDPELQITEIPIMTMPLFALPIHPTALFFFGRWYTELAKALLPYATGTNAYILHAIDFLESDAAQHLSDRVVALRHALNTRLSVIEGFLRVICEKSTVTSRDFLSYQPQAHVATATG